VLIASSSVVSTELCFGIVYSEDTLVVGVARVGQKDQMIKAGRMIDVRNFEFGAPLHSLVIPAQLQPIEQEFLDSFM